ncbi:HSP20 family protein [Enterococcus sp. PF1-24]|uniref:Hsp20/alpha crystallin family protein n=1 Tax=unclassified Enterococcus TaxID=2608891 RepID=UPI00247404E2|nr:MULTISPECIES: Hsp20/alpha crystallin family protein [unclassified Enterococcus]MDH6365817.1 HSP20 family protein [Enterococcus sp. PFB1-1]MDH6402915.1 HSP20 family protein [Enterococcus sp. PF1-24]
MANIVPRKTDLITVGDSFIDSMFQGFFDNDNFQVDIKEVKDKYEVSADLPGFERKDLTVTYNDNILTIEASRNDTIEDNDKDEEGMFIRRERSTRSYRRQFILKGVEEGKIKAKFHRGVLHLDLPKSTKHHKENRKIEIE